MSRGAPTRIEIVCETCGVIGEVFQPRSASVPRLCTCPVPPRVKQATRPRYCIHCSARLNRYNTGTVCGPCRLSRDRAALSG